VYVPNVTFCMCSVSAELLQKCSQVRNFFSFDLIAVFTPSVPLVKL